MTSLTIKNIPEGIYERLKSAAAANRRSINSEVIQILDETLYSSRIDPEAWLPRVHRIREKTAEYTISESDLGVAKADRASMIVVDTNVIAYLFLKGEFTERAEALLRVDSEWAVPLLWRSELQNVLALYLRSGILSAEDCLQVMQTAGELVRGREFTVPTARVFESVRRSGCSAYDCEFVALAEDLDVPLVTADRQILGDFPNVAVSLEVYLDK